MEYFQRTAERKGTNSMGSVRTIQSKHPAVTLMAVENFNLEATLEMRREAARDMAGEGDALWVMAGYWSASKSWPTTATTSASSSVWGIPSW